MDRWLERDMVIRIVAVVLAIGLWFSVSTAQQAAEVQRTFEGVKVQVRNLEPGYAVAELSPGTVSVTVRGNERDISRYDRDDFLAWINLQGPLEEGVTDFAVEKISVPRGVALLGYSPNNVRIRLERVIDRTRFVGVTMNGTPGEGYTTGQPDVNPAEVILRGPASLIDRVAAVWVAVDIEEADSDVIHELPVILVDDQSQPVSGIQVIPAQVRVRVPVHQLQGSRTVSVEPNIIGQPATGYTVGEIKVSPAEVVLSGPEQILQTVDKITTAEIDLRGADSSFEQEKALNVPRGLQVNPQTVTVQVRMDRVGEP